MKEGSFYRGEYKEEEVRGSDVARGQSRPIGGAGASIKNEALYGQKIVTVMFIYRTLTYS